MVYCLVLPQQKFSCTTHYIVFFYADKHCLCFLKKIIPFLFGFCTLKLPTAPVTLSVNSPNLVNLFRSIQISLMFTTKQLWFITFYSILYSSQVTTFNVPKIKSYQIFLKYFSVILQSLQT